MGCSDSTFAQAIRLTGAHGRRAAIAAAKLSDPEEAEISKYIAAFVSDLPLPKQPKNVQIGFRVSPWFSTVRLDAKESKQ